MDLHLIQKVVSELKSEINGGIISKIFQPLPRDIVLKLYVRGAGEKRLMLSADPKLGRIHLTDLRIPNPPRPPRFCAYLRARLVNSRIVDVTCAPDDRVVNIACERRAPDSMTKMTLILELLGRDSNIIIIDTDKKIIMDSLHHIPDKHSNNRIVIRGVEYVPPPPNPRLLVPAGESDRGATVAKPLSSLDFPDGTRSFNKSVDRFYMSLLTNSLTENLRREVARPAKAKIRSLETRRHKIEEDIKRLQKFIAQGKYGELLKTNLGKFQ
ncbi:MAG: NFACT family protein, partial [Desulfomonilaceae bacterium]